MRCLVTERLLMYNVRILKANFMMAQINNSINCIYVHLCNQSISQSINQSIIAPISDLKLQRPIMGVHARTQTKHKTVDQ